MPIPIGAPSHASKIGRSEIYKFGKVAKRSAVGIKRSTSTSIAWDSVRELFPNVRAKQVCLIVEIKLVCNCTTSKDIKSNGKLDVRHNEVHTTCTSWLIIDLR